MCKCCCGDNDITGNKYSNRYMLYKNPYDFRHHTVGGNEIGTLRKKRTLKCLKFIKALGQFNLGEHHPNFRHHTVFFSSAEKNDSLGYRNILLNKCNIFH